MLISAKSDYAIRALLELASAGGESRTCDQIAAAQGIPRSFLGRILNDLRRSGLLRSQRGSPGGGWRLALSADAITLADVVSAIDGRIDGVRAWDGGTADTSAAAVVHELRDAIDLAVRDVLANASIGQLASRMSPLPATPTHEGVPVGAFGKSGG